VSDSVVLKEFLVALGYKNDEAALRKFENGITQVTKVVVGFAAAVEASAFAVAVGVAKMANNLERLYFASQRTGTAASSLKAFDRAAQSFGASAGDALSAAEGLATFFRKNPGGRGWLDAMLGQVGESADGKDQVQVLASLAKLFAANKSRGTEFQNYQIGGQLGLSDNLIQAMTSGDFLAKLQQLQKQMKNSGLDGAAAHAHKFEESLRSLGNQLYYFGIQVVDSLQLKFGKSLDDVSRILERNGPQWAKEISDFVGHFIDDFNQVLTWVEANAGPIHDAIKHAFDAIREAYDTVKPIFEWLKDKFVELDEKTGGWSTKLLALAVALKAIGVTEIVGGVLNLAAAFVRLGAAMAIGTGTGLTGILAGIVTAANALGALLVIVSGGIGYVLGSAINNMFPKLSSTLGAGMERFAEGWSHLSAQFMEKYSNQDSRRNYVVDRLKSMGWSDEQAVGIAANLQQESDYKSTAANGSHYGVAQWDKAGQDRYAAWAANTGARDGDIHGADLGEQLDFLNFDARKMGMAQRMASAANYRYDAAALFSRYYERPGTTDAERDSEANARGNLAKGLGVNVTNNITVTGVTDPHHTANEIQRRLERLNAETARQFAPTGSVQ
jgi:hypothetical protein